MDRRTRTVLWALWLLVFAAGLVGLVQRLRYDHDLTAYGSYVPWGLWVGLYFHGVGIAGGVYLLGVVYYLFLDRTREAEARLRAVLALSVVSLLMGLLAIWFDLGRMDRAWRILTAPNFTSMMSFNAWMYGFFLILAAACFVLSYRPARWTWFGPLLLLGLPMAMAFPSQSGAFFGVVDAKPYWHTALFPVLFLMSALAAGAGALAAVEAFLGRWWSPEGAARRLAWLRWTMLVAVGLYFVLEWSEISIAYWSPTSDHREAWNLVMFGPFWWVFWGVHLLAGGLAPLALLTFWGGGREAVGAAGLLVAATFVSTRLNILIPGQALAQLEGLQEAFYDPRLSYTYVATVHEYLLSLFLVAVGTGLFALAVRFLPGMGLDRRPGRAAPAAAPASGGVDAGRRRLLQGGVFLGGSLLASASPALAAALPDPATILKSRRPDAPYDLADPENVLYTVCLNCNTGCGIKVKLENGVVTKVDGNPYNPWTMLPHIPYAASPVDAARVDGAICPKGQAGLQAAYDPYRIRKVLKRAGRRGENRWQTIPVEQAVQEIVEGGYLFRHVPGEENRRVEGLREIMALRDPAVAKAMATDVEAIWAGKLTVEEFKARHAQHLDVLIDPDHPDLGPKNNQFVIAWGRLKGGRKDLIKRFGAGFGTTNLHGHTTVCQGSLYFTCKAMSEQYKDGKFTGGKKFYWQADTEHSRFVLFVGANLFEANYGPPNRAVRLTRNLASGRTRIAVVDPRFSKLAAKAWKWLPIKPGTDAALALAMGRWILGHGRYDERFLRAANRAAAAAAGELSWCNATWLVKLDPATGEPGAFLRAAEAGLADPDATEDHRLVVMQDGQLVAFDPDDAEHPVTGELFVDAALPDGTRVKSSLQIYKESAFERTVEEWCAIAGVSPDDAAAVARELTSHGKRAAVDCHRGPAQHTNGFYNVLAWMSLNVLLGNFDWQGGMVAASTYKYDKAAAFDLTAVPGKLAAFGVSVIRHGVDYARTTLFKGYPARRNWYPLSSDVYQEIVPSIGDAYPYPVKALLLYMGAPTYALPAGHTNIPILADVERLPLFIASDIVVGTTSMYADYIFPDLSYFERWEFQGSHPNVAHKVQPVRQPVIAPVPENCLVYGEEVPICLESTLMAFAERLGLKAFGPDALGPGLHLKRPEDYYVRAVANLAAGDKPGLAAAVPPAGPEELALFERARRHLPPAVFDAAYWRRLVGDELWPRVVTVLNRGGRFQDYAEAYRGDRLGNPYRALINLYQEKTAQYRYAGTGAHYPGVARYVPVADYHGRPVDGMADGYDLALITHRTITQTKSRTITNYWLLPILPENHVLLNPADGRRLGLRDGQPVRVVSASNPEGTWDLGNGVRRAMVGPVRLTETIAPGVVSFVLGFGHWATGAEDVEVDGSVIPGDRRRAAGFHANAAMWVDPALKNTCLLDPVGGSVSFYDTRVRLVPEAGPPT